MPKQYISVSGVGNIEQLQELERYRPTELDAPELIVGVQASEKSQFQKVENSRGRGWHPVGDEIWSLFSNDLPRIAKRVIHYSLSNPSDPSDTVEKIEELLGRTPDTCLVDGMQFNGLRWHEQSYEHLMQMVHSRLGEDFIIAQLSSRVLQEAQPVKLAKRLGDHGVSHALLDSSGGSGTEFDPSSYRPFIDALVEYAPHVGIGIAGGLGPDNIAPYAELLKGNILLSCDAEGRLRVYPEGPTNYASSRLSMSKTGAYLVQTYDVARDASSDFDAWWKSIDAHHIGQNYDAIKKLHADSWDKLRQAPGSTHNHQFWPGGYMEHIRQVNHYARRLYYIWLEMGTFDDLKKCGEGFTLSDALLVLTLHDIEKIFRCSYGQNGELIYSPNLMTKPAREAFKQQLLGRYHITLADQQAHALHFVEGMRDADYTAGKRVMSPLAAFVHACDLMSARGSYNVNNPGDTRPEL